MFERITANSADEKRWLCCSIVVAVILLAADQLTKEWFVRNFQLYQTVEIIPGWLNFTYVRNLGAAWSMFHGHVWPLLIFSVVVAAGIILFLRRLTEGCPERYVSLLMVVAGTLGNAIDRGFRGAVVDFIHVHYHAVWHYPVFNVADIAICTGVGLFVLSNFLRKKPEDKVNTVAGEK